MRENNDKSKKFTLKDRKPVSQNHGENSPKPERTERPKVDRSSDGGFNREKRSEGGFGRDRRSDDRSSGGGFNREKRSEGGFGRDRRSDDRSSGGGFNREKRSEGGFGRDRRSDDRSSGGGFNREKRSEGGFGRERRSDDRSSGGGFNREKRSEGGFGRERRSDDRSSGGGFNREKRSEGGFGRDKREGGFGRDRRSDDRSSGGGFNREKRSEGGFNRERRSDDRSSGGGFNRENRSDGGFGRDRREGGFNRERRSDDRSSGGGFNREKRSEGGFGRDRREGGFGRDKREGGFNRERRSDDRSSGGGFNREKRSEGGFGRDKREGGFGRDRRSDGFDRGERREKPESFKEEKPGKIKRIKRERTESKETRSGFGYKGSNRDFEKAGSHLQKGSELLNTDIRLNRYISNSGLCSRREADQMILEGLVQVNGNAVNELGTKVSKKDVVKVDGKRIMPEKPIYILLNKPKGYITTTEDPEGRKTVMDLIDLPGKERIYPVGRLDRNTTGVLLLTNDGEFSQKLTHPSFQIKKIYRAKLDRKPSKEHMLAWVEGVELEDGIMTFEQVGFVDENDQTILGLEVHSGRNRVVRRMFEHFKYEVEALDRVLMGEFDKIKLGRGKWRLLNDKETGYIERLKRTKPKPPPTDLKSDSTSLDLSDEEWDDMMNEE